MRATRTRGSVSTFAVRVSVASIGIDASRRFEASSAASRDFSRRAQHLAHVRLTPHPAFSRRDDRLSLRLACQRRGSLVRLLRLFGDAVGRVSRESPRVRRLQPHARLVLRGEFLRDGQRVREMHLRGVARAREKVRGEDVSVGATPSPPRVADRSPRERRRRRRALVARRGRLCLRLRLTLAHLQRIRLGRERLGRLLRLRLRPVLERSELFRPRVDRLRGFTKTEQRGARG